MYIRPANPYKKLLQLSTIISSRQLYTLHHESKEGEKKKEREIKERNKGKKKKRKKEEKKKPILFHHGHGNKLGLQVLVMPAEEHDHTPSYDV